MRRRLPGPIKVVMRPNPPLRAICANHKVLANVVAPKHEMKTPNGQIPWLVRLSDFQRYIYRAVRACRGGRVIFIVFKFKGSKQQEFCAMRRFPDHGNEYAEACASFAAGRIKKVRLRNLPAIRRASSAR